MKTITTDNTVVRTSKPIKSEIGKINNNLKHRINITSATQLNDLLVNNGFSWSPAIFKDNKRKNANWLEQSIYVLDFDDGITPETVIERCKRNGIIPNLLYTTFSDSPSKRKFRAVFFLDEIINDSKDGKFIQINLMRLFPECDAMCKDLSRFFYGGLETILINETLNNKTVLYDILNTFVIANNHPTKNRTRGIKKSVKNAFLLNNNSCAVETPKTVRNYDYIKVSKSVKILDDFINGKWLYHMELFGLATNLYYIEGGLTFFNDTMLKHNKSGKTHYTDNNLSIVPYIRTQKYKPQNLSNFSPYEEDHQHTNLLYINNWHRGKIEIIHKHKKLTLMEAENKLKVEFETAINSKEKNIYLFRVSTGLGKTRLLEDLKNVSIALPTHNLKDELVERMKHDEIIVVPKLPEFSEPEINKHIKWLYENNLSSEVTMLITNLSRGVAVFGNNVEITETDITLAQEYKDNLKECKSTSKTLLTTHMRGVHSETDHDTIIFDEDPIEQQLNISRIKQDELEHFKNTDSDVDINIALKWLNLKTEQTFEKMKIFKFSYKKLLTTANKIRKPQALKFLKSKYFFKENGWYYFISKTLLPKDKKIIIMSASASIPLYKQMYGDRLKVVNIDNVETKGQLIQHTKLSCSRTGLNSYHHIIDELVGDLPTITFKNYKQYFKNAVKNMHFNNCSGYDELKGKDIAVVGTDHKPNYMYIFYALALGYEINNGDTLTPVNKIVEWNGFKFKFNTFESKFLRELQLSLIETEILQAVGRNRILREDCVTHLYSNLPLKITNKFDW